MADKKISQLTSATTPLDGTEVLPIVQSGATVKVANNDLRPKQIQSNATSGVLQIAGPAAAATRVMTTPDANFTAARTDAAQSFTGNQTLSTGNLVVGTSGKGIDFSANTNAPGMTSELFTWYEEGTWTPVLTPFGGGSITLSSPADSMRYTRIGRLVTLTGLINVSSVSTPTGDLRLTGLPFSIGGSSAGSLSVFNFGTTSTVTAYQVLVDGSNTNTVFIRGMNNGSQVTTISDNIQAGSGMYFTLQYIV